MSKKVKPTETQTKIEVMMFGVEDAVEVLHTKWLAKRQAILVASREGLDEAVEGVETLIESLKEAIDVSAYNHTSETLGIRSRVQDVNVKIRKTIEDSVIRITLMLTDTDITSERYTPEFGKFRDLPMSDHAEMYEVISAANKTVEAIEKAHRKLNEKLEDAGNVRRQLHAKVMEIRLVDAGLTDIFDNEDIIAILDI